MTKIRFSFPGDTDPFLLVELLNGHRTEWDKNTVVFEELKRISAGLAIVRSAIRPPAFFLQARDFVEKRIQFVDSGVYYGYISSVAEEAFPPSKGYTRADTIFCVNIIGKEGNECVYSCVTQTDIKVMNLPQIMMAEGFKSAVKAFYADMVSAVSKAKGKPALN